MISLRSILTSIALFFSIAAQGQGFNTLSVQKVTWTSDAISQQTLDTSSINAITGDATGTLLIDLAGSSSIIDATGNYQDPGIAFACRLTLPGGGDSQFVTIENGVGVGFGRVWHAKTIEAKTLTFNKTTGAGVYRIACPLDNELQHLQFSTSPNQSQVLHYWLGSDGELGTDVISDPTTYHSSGEISFLVYAPTIQLFRAPGTAKNGVPLDVPTRTMVVIGSQSNQTRSINISISIPDYPGNPIQDGSLTLSPSTITLAPGENIGFFEVTIHDDGLLFPTKRSLSISVDVDGNDAMTTEFDVASLAYPKSLIDATGDGVWPHNRTCIYGTSGGGSNFPPPPHPAPHVTRFRPTPMAIQLTRRRQPDSTLLGKCATDTRHFVATTHFWTVVMFSTTDSPSPSLPWAQRRSENVNGVRRSTSQTELSHTESSLGIIGVENTHSRLRTIRS